ncbi:uncharacterized protein LOC100679887 [Nasonia vitripennis]|uniref:Uncharacterized protein n=1 Tax=Nasonia vitripennis TaxID=7425 RepID=A0A7M7Q7N1_NASVI|nr:uncharacterized protein LOC100679887 [Nasonia vitripennis]
MQGDFFKNKYAETLIENEKLKAIINQFVPKESCRPIANHNNLSKSDNEVLRKTVYDKVFEISKTPTYVTDPTQAANVSEPAVDEDIVVLKKGVKCNANAYKDAFKTTKCQTFFTLINTGIYGTEELAKRCVCRKKPADENIRVLSPIKKSVVEDEFYKFLVAKGYTQAQIDIQMETCSSYQHNAITAARKKLSRAKPPIIPSRTIFPPGTETATSSFQSYHSHPRDPLLNSFNENVGATEKSQYGGSDD